jgi:predicted nuclease of predicted toxin-antitoxin system
VAAEIRFHLDEHMGNDLARALRRAGIDVTTTVEAGLRTHSDQDQLIFALRESRILVTHDQDFLRLAAQRVPHAGIVYCAHGTRTLGQVIESLLLIHGIYSPDEMFNQVEFL